MTDIEKINNELFERYDEAISKLEEYETRVIPKFRIQEKLFTYNEKEKKITNFKVDEIRISTLGIFYLEYIDEKNCAIYSEDKCFQNIMEAQSFFNKNKSEKENTSK